MYTNEQQLSGEQWRESVMPRVDRFQFIEARITKINRQGRLQITPVRTGPMSQEKRDRFLKRFVAPMMNHDIARKLLVDVNRSPHAVSIAWGNGQFGFNGTIALDRPQALGGRGSAAVIFIDESAPDWANLKTIAANPDVGLFHELLHARHIHQGTLVDDEKEMEHRVIGIGRYLNSKGTENSYRESRNLPRRCCRDRETLQGIPGFSGPPLGGERCRCSQARKTAFGTSLGEPASPAEFTEAEKEAVAAAIKTNVRSANQLSDAVFFRRYPGRGGKLIDPKTEPALVAEWKRIKSRLVLPILDAINWNEQGNEAIFSDQHARAIDLFDRARRVVVAPVEFRATVTMNLGIANLKLKRFAAAIGYFEIARTFPGISDRLKAKADKLFERTKQEYRQAVP